MAVVEKEVTGSAYGVMMEIVVQNMNTVAVQKRTVQPVVN